MFPMTPEQSWLFLFLVFYSISVTLLAYYWLYRYRDAQSYRVWLSKQAGYKRTQMDELYSRSFYKD